MERTNHLGQFVSGRRSFAWSRAVTSPATFLELPIDQRVDLVDAPLFAVAGGSVFGHAGDGL
ncbi:hypothetical protein ACH47B_35130 [Rhodococcus sp. NPDC019627]|uniref:hypothetical protein n=1 Tax=unclassified Rhodococcus (in: high G+C Gram-positive bacteria) TaxID=192944 RepID=UPI003410E381